MEMLVPIFLFACIAGVLILRPITKRLGLLIQVLAEERARASLPRPLDGEQLERITHALDRLNSRLDLVDDRVAFMERLVESRPARRLTG